jgi:hypothetical protein
MWHLLGATPALGQINSPGIAPSKIEVDDPLRQGDDIRLPSLIDDREPR